MTKGSGVIQVINGQFGRQGWKTVRAAMTTWGNTARFVTIVLAVAIPTLVLAVLVRWSV
jgi:hypothetical protein